MKTGRTNKVGKNAETADTKANKEAHFKQVSVITNTLRSIGGFFTKIAKKVRELVKKHPKKSNVALVVLTHVACKRAKELDDKVQDKSKQAEKENQINWWKYSGLTIATSLLLAACSVGDVSEQIELEQEKQKTEQEKQKTSNIETNNQIKVEQEKQKTSNIETNNQIKVEQEKQKTSNIETSNQIKVEQEKQKTEQEKKEAENARDRANKSGIELEQERQKTIKTQKDFIKDLEQNCKENHGQFFIEKGGTKAGIGGITIEVEAECKTPKPTKTNQTPIQPKHLPNSK